MQKRTGWQAVSLALSQRSAETKGDIWQGARVNMGRGALGLSTGSLDRALLWVCKCTRRWLMLAFRPPQHDIECARV